MNRSEDDTDVEVRRTSAAARATRRRRVALALLVLVSASVATVWLQRRTIAQGFVDRALARRGVPARYTIDQLSPWRQRLTGVSIGDPRDPDLTADWIELRTALSPWRAELLVAKAGRVRIKGRIVNGVLSLGSLDRLMPPPSGKPFTLPRLSVEVADAQLRLESDAGLVLLGLRGKGLLADGFAGTLHAQAGPLKLGSCALSGFAAAMELRIRKGAPSLTGPLAAQRLACGAFEAKQPRGDVRVTLDDAFAGWTGDATLAVASLRSGVGTLGRADARLDFAGDRVRTAGDLRLDATGAATKSVGADAVDVAGRYAIGRVMAFDGRVRVQQAMVSPRVRAEVTGYRNALAGTPIGPLAAKFASAVDAAGRRFDGVADLGVATRGRGVTLRVKAVDLTARSGAWMRFVGASGAVLDIPAGTVALAGRLSLGGGGLPDAAVDLLQRPGSDQLQGTGTLRPYAAGGARLALSNLYFTARGGAGSARTVATLSGPIGGGQIDDVSMPLVARWNGPSVLVNPGCATLGFARIAASGMVLRGHRQRLCPVGPAMVAWNGKRLTGGAQVRGVALTGTMGSNPLRLAAGGIRLDLASRAFDLTEVAVRMGAEHPTRLDIGRLGGTFGNTPSGDFEALGGQIGAVPLILSQGKGRWQVADGALSLLGSFRLADADPSPRFEPLLAPAGRLHLQGNRIEARADLVGTKRPVPVASVAITHDLGRGEGQALLDVAGIRFRTGGLQPTDLTPLTLGVIADVDGTIAGTGKIAWAGEAVTSIGRFTATNMSLAAAFGPVQGLTTELNFTDLLNAQTAPAQVAKVTEVNPGVPVRDGVFRYQLLDSRRVRVEGARWPFAGGELVLEPTTLDFNESGERRMTFLVKGVDAALFLKEMAFDNLDATGTFDGTLPMIFDETGGRIEGGVLRARKGGHLAYVGEVSREDLGTWGNMAFQALKSLDYRSLAIRMNGPLAGEMITDISFSGLSQGQGTKSNFLIRRLAKLPLVFNVRINAPFRQLLDSVQSWYDPRRLIERNLPALLEEQKRAQDAGSATVQPAESTPRP
ncbi:YdbH domain-containing protein [uncultured Sphingomonas sp.]|uniref:YdbH domain-containing protein n=1 Tax=uncultured Sphingomonas sp. TaxID=158754 RepID=UPI0025FA6779|nr:YdbH domain-containing protein [uncultured Sphingomonas sp.]